MGKALTKRLSIDIALRAHKCRFNKRHLIPQGSSRLKVTEGRSEAHYCIECAQKFVEVDIKKLNDVLNQIKSITNTSN